MEADCSPGGGHTREHRLPQRTRKVQRGARDRAGGTRPQPTRDEGRSRHRGRCGWPDGGFDRAHRDFHTGQAAYSAEEETAGVSSSPSQRAAERCGIPGRGGPGRDSVRVAGSRADTPTMPSRTDRSPRKLPPGQVGPAGGGQPRPHSRGAAGVRAAGIEVLSGGVGGWAGGSGRT